MADASESRKIICFHCGAPNAPDAVVCEACSTSLKPHEAIPDHGMHEEIRGLDQSVSHPGNRILIVFVGEWLIMGTAFLCCLCILGMFIRGVVEMGLPGAFDLILMGFGAIFVILMMIVTGKCLLKDTQHFFRGRHSPQSRSLSADSSHEVNSPETCLACGRSMPINGETCSACGWSYLGHGP